MSTWPSPDPYAPANIDPEHKFNTTDHSFNPLSISNPIVTVVTPLVQPAPPIFTSPADEREYLNAILQKLTLARKSVENETKHGLDVDRHMDKDVTAQLLCVLPIVFNLQTQQVIGDLVKLRKEMVELAERGGESAEKMQELGYQFLWAWKELRGVLEWLVPGKTKSMSRGRVEKIMLMALGESLVEEGEDGGGDGGDEDEDDREKAFV
jgi:hypothetical protein